MNYGHKCQYYFTHALTEKTISTATSWVKQKATPNLKDANAETIVALPSLMRYGTHPIWTFRDVNGAATEASAMDKLIPA